MYSKIGLLSAKSVKIIFFLDKNGFKKWFIKQRKKDLYVTNYNLMTLSLTVSKLSTYIISLWSKCFGRSQYEESLLLKRARAKGGNYWDVFASFFSYRTSVRCSVTKKHVRNLIKSVWGKNSFFLNLTIICIRREFSGFFHNSFIAF